MKPRKGTETDVTDRVIHMQLAGVWFIDLLTRFPKMHHGRPTLRHENTRAGTWHSTGGVDTACPVGT